MTSPSKIKGNNFEREIVKLFQTRGYYAKRAYASNGQSLGLHEEVDIIASGVGSTQLKLQCKRRKKLPDFLGFTEHVDAVVFKEDRGDIYIMFRLEEYLNA